MHTDAHPRISAAVCARNEAEVLPAAISSLQQQSCGDYEVLIVDSASTDDTCDFLSDLQSRNDPRCRIFRETRPGLSRARNRALCEARSPLVAFIDADAIADADWLNALLESFEAHPQAAVVGGQIRIHWDHPRPPWWRPALDEALNHFAPSDEPGVLKYPKYPYGTNFAVRCAALQQTRVGFASELGRCGRSLLAAEEGDVCLQLERAGWEVRYAPQALIHHRTAAERLSRRYILRRAFHHGRSQYLLESRNGFESGHYPGWGQIARSILDHGVRGRWDLPYLKYITFRIGYRWQRASMRSAGA